MVPRSPSTERLRGKSRSRSTWWRGGRWNNWENFPRWLRWMWLPSIGAQRAFIVTLSPRTPVQRCHRPQGRGTGHAKHSLRAATPTYQVRYLVLVTLKCASNASPLIRLAMWHEGRIAPFQRIRLWTRVLRFALVRLRNRQ